MVKYKSSFPDGVAVDAALTVAANIEENREGTGTKFLKDDLTWEELEVPELTFGTTAGTACEGNDSRLSNARTPTSHNDSYHTGSAKRNGADGVCGLYSCKTILNESRPVCTKQYQLFGKYLDGADNPDCWFPIAGAGGGSVVYSSRALTLTSGTAAASASRAVIDQTQFNIGGNFLEVTAEISTITNGSGGTRDTAIGFMSAFSDFQATNRVVFHQANDGLWYVAYAGGSVGVATLPLGRNLQGSDIVTVRLDRVEGQANINIARFYVNGQKQYETTSIPAVNLYAGVGTFATAETTAARVLGIKFFGLQWVP